MNQSNKSSSFRKLFIEHFCNIKHKRDVSRLYKRILACLFFYYTFSELTHMHPYRTFMDRAARTISINKIEALGEKYAIQFEVCYVI